MQPSIDYVVPSFPLETSSSSEEAIASKIDGMFHGWDGRTVFKLRNGQVWQQADFHVLYRFAYGPRVRIRRAGSSYQLYVEGVDTTTAVKRLR